MITLSEIEDVFDINRQIGMWQSQQFINGPWASYQRELTDTDLKEHLAGKIWIATRPRGATLANIGSGSTTRWLIIDIDDHGDRSDRYGPVESRLQTILRILNIATPIVFSSTRGQGKHIYYKCSKELPINKLLVPVVNFFLEKNIFIAKDGIEIHPGQGHPFRLPFGRMQVLERIGPFRYKKLLTGLNAFIEIRNHLHEIMPLQPSLLSEK